MAKVSSLLGKVANEKGSRTETRFIEALNSDFRPSWLFRAKKAPKTLDQKGIDVIVETDVGNIFVQVKSSKMGKKKFNAQSHGRREIVVVVVSYTGSDEQIVHQALSGIVPIRKKYLLLREKSLLV